MESARHRSEPEKCPDTVIPQYEELQITAGPSDLKKVQHKIYVHDAGNITYSS